MKTLKTIDIWELTEPLKFTAIHRTFSLMDFNSFFRYEKPKVRKIIKKDLKIAEAENEEANQFIREFATKAGNEAIRNIPF